MIRTQRRNEVTHRTDWVRKQTRTKPAKAKKAATLVVGEKSSVNEGRNRVCAGAGHQEGGMESVRQRAQLRAREERAQGSSLRDQDDLLRELASTEPGHQREDARTTTACLVRDLQGRGTGPGTRTRT